MEGTLGAAARAIVARNGPQQTARSRATGRRVHIIIIYTQSGRRHSNGSSRSAVYAGRYHSIESMLRGRPTMPSVMEMITSHSVACDMRRAPS